MESKKPFHILSLSGGGFKGLYTATVLCGLEKRLGSPLARRFDLLCGTSIGGILTLGLSLEIPADELSALFLEKGELIFKKRAPVISNLITAKYSNNGLKEALKSVFDNKKIGDLKHKVVIPSINFTKGSGQFFKTPHNKKFYLDHERSLVDVALATSAAPLYFPMHKTDFGIFVDGGLVGNAPGLYGVHEAKYFLNQPEENIRLLSIGAISKSATTKSHEKCDAGLMRWNKRLIELILSAQESSTDYMLKHILGKNYIMVDGDLSGEQLKSVSLDSVSEESKTILIQQGKISLQKLLGDERINLFSEHSASESVFYKYGEAINVN